MSFEGDGSRATIKRDPFFHMKAHLSKSLYCVGILTLLGGCTVGPSYKNPAPETQKQTSLTAEHFARDDGLWASAVPADTLPKGNWWVIFNDPQLAALLEQAARDNPDLASAFYKMEQAREAAAMKQSELYPWLDGNASYNRFRNSYNMQYGQAGTFSDWMVGVGLTWDADLFGRIRSLVKAEKANAQAMRDAYQTTLLMLQTQVANTYFTLRQYKSEISLLQRTLAVRKDQTAFVQKRVRMDFSSDVDLQRALQEEYDASAQLAGVQRQLVLAENYLADLLGTVPAKLKLSYADLGDTLPKLPAAVPSQLLERRADVSAAERQVFAANARIGAATAAFFPTVSITGNTGLEAGKLDKLMNASSFAWGVSPQVYIPLFQAGRLSAQKQVSLAAYKQTVEDYRSVVLRAIRQVEDALSDINMLGVQYDRRDAVCKASNKVEELTRKQYDLGYIDYFSVSDAQRQALLNERERLRLKGDRFRACVALVSSLGGGWSEKEPTPIATPLKISP